jgi:hypothetical protein
MWVMSRTPVSQPQGRDDRYRHLCIARRLKIERDERDRQFVDERLLRLAYEAVLAGAFPREDFTGDGETR